MPRAGCSIHWLIATAGCVLVVGAAAALSASRPDAQPVFACTELACGMPAEGAFPHFVVGRIAAIATAREAESLFTSMRARRRWSALPAGADAFWRNVQPMAIDVGDATFVVLTSQEEARAVPAQPGDLVRYSPHRGSFEVPPADAIAASYYAIDGCVEILCRQGDGACARRYAAGVFRTADGRQLSATMLHPLRWGTRIDSETMFPQHDRKTR